LILLLYYTIELHVFCIWTIVLRVILWHILTWCNKHLDHWWSIKQIGSRWEAELFGMSSGSNLFANAVLHSGYELNGLTLSPPNKLSSAKFLVCFNFQRASISLKIGENVVWVSNSLDLDETPSYSASHQDPSCLHIALWLCLAG